MATQENGQVDRHSLPPFLLKLFYRANAFHRPDEFASPSHLPPYLPVYTWLNCTLTELSHHLVSARPAALPDPAIGTRLAFRLIYADTRSGGPNSPPRFVSKDLGSLVLGSGGPGAEPTEEDEDGGNEDLVFSGQGVATAAAAAPGERSGGGEARRTLADAKLVVGDYISCAILPPSPTTGAVAPASSAKGGRGTGPDVAPPPPLPPLPPATRDSGSLRGVAASRGGEFRMGGGGRHPGDRRRGRDSGVPFGEWRRGERLPDFAPGRGRGRGPRW